MLNSYDTLSKHCFYIENDHLRVEILALGARIQSLYVKDRWNHWQDVVLGYDELAQYEHDDAYFGALVGRCAGRIEEGWFSLDGTTYQLAKNNCGNHLHGGNKGFSFRMFQVVQQQKQKLVLSYTSPDQEEGYPGTIQLQVSYTVQDHRLYMDYAATSDRTTPLNITNHSYFNLHGAGQGEVHSHLLQICASKYCPNTVKFLPDQEKAVTGSFNFRRPTPLSSVFAAVAQDPQLHQANGIDHYFRFSAEDKHEISLYEPATGINLQIQTDQPGVQIYTPYHEKKIGKEGRNYAGRCAVAIEPQKKSNSLHSDDCEVIIGPEQPYEQHTVYTFSLKHPK